MLAEEKQTKNLYAIKVLKKDFIIENDEVERYQRISEKFTNVVPNAKSVCS